VTWVVFQLDQAEVLEQRRHVHREATPVALPKSVPATCRVFGRSCPVFEGAILGRLVLVGGAELHLVATNAQHLGHVDNTAGQVAQPSRADLTDQLGRIGRIIAVHRELCSSRCSSQHPRSCSVPLAITALLSFALVDEEPSAVPSSRIACVSSAVRHAGSQSACLMRRCIG